MNPKYYLYKVKQCMNTQGSIKMKIIPEMDLHYIVCKKGKNNNNNNSNNEIKIDINGTACYDKVLKKWIILNQEYCDCRFGDKTECNIMFLGKLKEYFIEKQ